MTVAPDFDWSPDDPCVVIKSQPALAVYQNPHGAIVIRQESQHHPDEDCYVYLQPENAIVLAEAITALARELLRFGTPALKVALETPARNGDGRQIDAFANGRAATV